MTVDSRGTRALDATSAWALLLALARAASRGAPVDRDVGLGLRADGTLEEDGTNPWIHARPSTARGFAWPDGAVVDGEAERLLDLYLPLCVGAASGSLVLAHLAQTLDGRVALASGNSQFISGDEDLVHCHRLRALFDVVIVGRRTVEADDPQLTARRCEGPSPVRAVLDPDRRLGEGHHVFQAEGPPTLLICKRDGETKPRHGRAEIVRIDPRGDRLAVEDVLAELRRRGLRRVYVEGGGITVSRFLEEGALARLQVTVSPILFGSGRPAFTLPEIHALADAKALRWRHATLGRDVLFDCEVPR